MKTTTLTIGMLGLALQFAGINANAQVNLEYRGGPTSTISPAEIQVLKAWSQNALADIERLLNNIQPMLDGSDLKRKLSAGMETIVQNSEPKSSDLLLRHAIYAGLTVNKLIEQESIRKGMENAAQGTVDQQVRILKKSLNMAKEYYKSDFAYINGILANKDKNYVNPKLIEFGVRFSQFLIKMSDGVMDASASYGMIRWSLGILANYMNQDSRNIAYASTIKYLYDELRQYPDVVTGQLAPEDVDCVKYVRELKRIAQSVFKEIAQTSSNISSGSIESSSTSFKKSKTSTSASRGPSSDYPLEVSVSSQYVANCKCYKVIYLDEEDTVKTTGEFFAAPLAVKKNDTTFVIGIGMNRKLQYIERNSPERQITIDFNRKIRRIEGLVFSNNLPAAYVVTEGGGVYLVDIQGRSNKVRD